MSADQPGEVTSLDLDDANRHRRRGLRVAVAGLVPAAVIGAVLGWVSSWWIGLVVGLVLAVALGAFGVSEARRRVWLAGTVVCQRGLGVRRVELPTAGRIEVVVSDAGRRRVVGLYVAGPPRNGCVSIPLAAYSGADAAELDVLGLRPLADALAEAEHSAGLVCSQLLIAQLRAQARGEGPAGRPLFLLASAAGGGRVPRRIEQQALVRFVAQLA